MDLALQVAGLRGKGRDWQWPADDHALRAYEDLSLLEAELRADDLIAKLRGVPIYSIQVELRRSKGQVAVQAGVAFSQKLLQEFEAIVDEDGGRLWTLQDFNTSPGEFMAYVNSPLFLLPE